MHVPENTPTAAPRGKTHWAVHVNHRHRSLGYAMLLLVLGLHLAPQDRSPLLWLVLVAHFAVYPQLAFWLARRAVDPMAAEIRHMYLDALSLGAWIAVLHFPLWISFVMVIGCLLNLTLYRGTRGWLEALSLLAIGCALAGWIVGWTLQPQTDPWVTALAMVSVSLYLFFVSLDSQKRSMRLRDTRQELQAKELALQQQLAEIQSLQAQLRDQARRDALTGLFNRHHLGDIMARELARCARDGQPLSLLMIDVDHFKQINDDFGHQVGDDVLRETARLLAERTRDSDMLFRYGGEEFLLVLVAADALVAKAVAEELRQRYELSPLALAGSPVMATLSIGVATFADHGSSFESLVQAADQALYRAKRAGRNRVEIA
ncbi:diguanylate cyclase [Rhodoferax sp. U11-2br]|nr:sensor domain-containing diguanylate cyclase [Rhodoferax sp. U11-2br]MBT3066405.1 diguanylate cyclase [Rhodoferax sp. U11-2br]